MTKISLALASVAVLLAACSSIHGPMGDHGAMAGDARCAAHHKEMAGKSPAEQRAAAEAHIRAMHGSSDAAHVERHLKMMEQRCGPAPAR